MLIVRLVKHGRIFTARVNIFDAVYFRDVDFFPRVRLILLAAKFHDQIADQWRTTSASIQVPLQPRMQVRRCGDGHEVAPFIVGALVPHDAEHVIQRELAGLLRFEDGLF